MINIEGNLLIRRFDEQGNLINWERVHNTVTQTGIELIRDNHISTAPRLPPHHFVLGSGTTAAASTDTGLQSSQYNISFTGTTFGLDSVTYSGAIYSTESTGTTFQEIGLFSSSSSIYCRALLTPFTQATSNLVTHYFDWDLMFTNPFA